MFILDYVFSGRFKSRFSQLSDFLIFFQTQPVKFVLQTVLTSSDLEFDANEVNFGYCTVCETVYKTIQLHNKSVLPQRYGFAATPEVCRYLCSSSAGKTLSKMYLAGS